MQKHPFSLVIITFNEESKIERCIKSVPMASEVIVLDSGSTDNTRELAEKCGAKVYNEAFRGYKAQKERATELANFEWVLSLDADEALSPKLKEELEVLFSSQKADEFDGYEISRANYHLGKWINHGGWYPDVSVRLFNKKRTKWVGGHVHERVRGEKIKRFKAHILHHVFDDLSDQVATNNKYSSLGAKDLQQRGLKFSVLKLIYKPCSKFFETYFFKKGFLDGLAGLIISVGAAYSVFLKFAKLWEIEKLEGKQKELIGAFEKRVGERE